MMMKFLLLILIYSVNNVNNENLRFIVLKTLFIFVR